LTARTVQKKLKKVDRTHPVLVRVVLQKKVLEALAWRFKLNFETHFAEKLLILKTRLNMHLLFLIKGFWWSVDSF